MSNIQVLKNTLDSDLIKNKIKDIVGKNAAVFTTSLVQIASQNNLLSEAEPNSIIGAALTSATLNLPLNNSLGLCYIVPFKEKGVQKAQFILGYKGLKQLAIRSGQYLHIYCKEVYEGQKVDDGSFLGYHFDWKNKTSNKIIGYASYYKLINGFESVKFMTVKEIDKHAMDYSKTYKSGRGNWVDNKEKMSKKTVTKLHLNSGEAPLSVEMQTAIQTDQAVFKDAEGSEWDYPDNKPIDVEEVSEAKEEKRILEYIENTSDIKVLEEEVEPFIITDKCREAYDKKLKELSK